MLRAEAARAPDGVDRAEFGNNAVMAAAPDLFAEGGATGRALAAVDWAATSLGEPGDWPQGLRTVVGTVLRSRFSMWMGWGTDLVFFCNDAYRRATLGEKFPWALGRPTHEVWAEIWPDIEPRIARVMAGDATWDEDLLLFLERTGFREETYHTFSYSPIAGDDGGVAGLLCVVTEDTERVISGRRLATLRDLGADPTAVRSTDEVVGAALRSITGNALDLPFAAIYTVDDDGGATLAGAAGIPVDHPVVPGRVGPGGRLLGQPLPNAIDAMAIADLPEGLPTGGWDEPPLRAVAVPLPQPGHVRPAGVLLAGLNRYRPLDDGYRSFLGLVAGQVGAALASARTYEAERERAEQLAEIDRAKTAFFTNVSHELRTPLTLLLGPADDALADRSAPLPAVQRERIEVVARNGLRLLKLVNTLLDFSRLEAGRLQAQVEAVDLAALTAELASGFAAAVHRAGLAFEVVREATPPVLVDPEMWAKVVYNLLSNALKFTVTGTITVLVTTGDDGGARLEVSDTGVGIDPAEQHRLFERFYRAQAPSARTHEGSGIGLALVAELVALHGGRVWVRSTPGAGSTFGVDIPAAVGAHRPAPASPVAGGGPGAGTGADTLAGHLAEVARWGATSTPADDAAVDAPPDRARVLVIDDNADMRDYVARLLADDYAVSTAGDGESGLALARSTHPDLVISDVMMPGLDGVEVLAALRADPATAATPVMLLSARAGEEATVEGLEAGADDYLVKPFDARELRARVRANLHLARAARAAIAAAAEAAEREHRIADELQRSLLPAPSGAPDGLGVATYYRPGVAGTQVGGDWFDVIELGAGRAALVIGDVMGRGVRAAAVMGQLRAAVRAYARLDLPPADVLSLLDASVRELGDDQIVTCVCAVFDPADGSLLVANAGHPPPLLLEPGAPARSVGAGGPPLGAAASPPATTRLRLAPGAVLALYTDGLVEHRASDLASGIDRLAAALPAAVTAGAFAEAPARLVEAMLPEGPTDDVAVLLAVAAPSGAGATARVDLDPDVTAAARARRFVATLLAERGAAADLVDAAELVVSELVTNAVVHGRPPVALRLRLLQEPDASLVLEVADGAAVVPRPVQAGDDDEHGRGLQIVAALAERWGTRTSSDGKVVWCRLTGPVTAGR
ncbi:MAG TPA: SpoIIE family protein phosphatase [Acidimicrobiales bacterium]|nr:SpoIIE family protein phosphatase [Acidimicrobiales bacterium]